MHLIGLAWIYVALLMAAVEATSSQGTLLGACFTFLLYGLLPVSVVLYVLGSPQRRRARLRAEHQAQIKAEACDSSLGAQADGGDHAAGEPLVPVGKEP